MGFYGDSGSHLERHYSWVWNQVYGVSGSHKHALLDPILHTTSMATQVATPLGTINTIGNNSGDSSSHSWKCHLLWSQQNDWVQEHLITRDNK